MKFYKSGYENDETQHLMHKVQDNYSSCTSRSCENICSSSGRAFEKGNWGQNRMELSLAQEIKWCISEFSRVNVL
jgi:hypothetical protein